MVGLTDAEHPSRYKDTCTSSMENTMHMLHRHTFSLVGLAMGLALGLAFATASMARPVAGHAAPKPAWPNNGIAQRMLPSASTMFVENDHGKLRAWVVSEPPGGENVEALDFFTGQKMKVKVDKEEDGRQEQSFTDAEGKFHSSIGQDYAFSGTAMPIELPGINFDGATVYLKNNNNGCYAHLDAARPINSMDSKSKSDWSKFPIYHSMSGPRECSAGSFHSKITSALDLNDGTFLAAEGCFVFRLRKFDLSAVGSAPALRVVDERVVRNVVFQIKNKNIQDATGYLADALKLPTASNLSCKGD